jgi:hypothetical protein
MGRSGFKRLGGLGGVYSADDGEKVLAEHTDSSALDQMPCDSIQMKDNEKGGLVPRQGSPIIASEIVDIWVGTIQTRERLTPETQRSLL